MGAPMKSRPPGGPQSVRPQDLVALSRGATLSRYGSAPRRSSSVGSSVGRSRSRSRWICREEFDRRYALLRAAQAGRKIGDREDQGFVSERGRETRWVAFRTVWRHTRASGTLDFRTTTPQRARAMELAGRARSDRTVQRVHRDLAAMGLVVTRHVHRGRATPGFRDCLHLRLVESYVTPPSAAEEGEQSSPSSSAPPTTGIAPPPAADPDPPPAAAVGTEEMELESEPVSEEADRWAQMMLARLERRRPDAA